MRQAASQKLKRWAITAKFTNGLSGCTLRFLNAIKWHIVVPMYRLAHTVFVFTAPFLGQLEFLGAQGIPQNITVDSVLTMAKEAAESGTTEFHRVLLRGEVAEAIRTLGRDAVFGDYVAKSERAAQLVPFGFRNVEMKSRGEGTSVRNYSFCPATPKGPKRSLVPGVTLSTSSTA